MKTIEWPNREKPIVTVYARHPYGDRVGFLHALPGGVPVLKGESSWRTVNGFYFKLKMRSVYVQWRRWFSDEYR